MGNANWLLPGELVGCVFGVGEVVSAFVGIVESGGEGADLGVSLNVGEGGSVGAGVGLSEGEGKRLESFQKISFW